MRIGIALASGLLALAACARNNVPPYDPPCIADDSIDCGDNPSVRCDDRDSTCKCGPIQNGLVCAKTAVCTPQGANEYTCLSSACDLVTCDRGMSCDPDTGTCACGGKNCSAYQTCESGVCTPPLCDDVKCNFGLSCDPADGVCKCAGGICADDKVCAEGKCVPADRCSPIFGVDCAFSGSCDHGNCICVDGVGCGRGTWCSDHRCLIDHCVGVNICAYPNSCDPSDGQCHCTGKGGPRTGAPACGVDVCQEDGTCLVVDPCTNVRCGSGAVCDPSPDPNIGGVCRCGGTGLEYPRCGADQACDLQKQQCTPFEGCQGVKCDYTFPGTSCDEEDGFCKCGGMGGIRCQVGELCLKVSGTPECLGKCDALADTCDGGDSCYVDSKHDFSVCLPPGHASEGAPCQEVNDCEPGLLCLPGSSPSSTCARLCPSGSTGKCPTGEVCVALDFDPKLGACIPSP